MNIKQQLKTVTITSILFTGFIFSSTSALAERHHQKVKSHSYSAQQQYSNSRSHTKKTQRNHYSNQHKSYKRHDSHRPTHYNGYGNNQHNVHHQHYSRYYSFPWYINQGFNHNGGFSIGYQDEHFGFTIRD